MIDAILDHVLTVRGITFLTYLCIIIAILVYLRIVLGPKIIERFRTYLFEITQGRKKTKSSQNKTNQIKSNLNKLHIPSRNQRYDEISMSGGDGRGTVTELLAQQTFESNQEREEKKQELHNTETKTSKGVCLEFDGYSIGDIFDAPSNPGNKS